MAVYEQTYRAYDGPRAADWSRWLVIPRYALSQQFASRLFLLFFLACLAYPLGCAAYLYVVNNLGMLTKIGMKINVASIEVGPAFFQIALTVQGLAAGLFLTLIVGPALVASDLRNNALALYLSRPITRWEYAVGKASALCVVLSAVTWVPLLVLVLLQTAFAGPGWLLANARVPFAVFTGSWLLIGVFTLVALAASAVARWRPAATALTFGVIMLGTPVGTAIDETLATGWGRLLSVNRDIEVAWSALFGKPLYASLGETAPLAAFLALGLLGAACVFILKRKLVAYEVVR